VWRIGRRLGVLVILFVALGLTLTVTSGWAAGSVNRGRQQLIRAHVPSNPLFPSGPLPATLNTAKSQLTRHGSLYEVTWTDCCGSDGALTTIVGFGRERTSALRRYIKFARQRLNPVRRIQVGRRRGIFIRGDITYFLYVPIGRFAYYVSNHSALDNTLSNREMVNMLASATNLGNEWVGQTTQGHVIDLYRTATGLDYYVEWHTDCEASGDRLYTSRTRWSRWSPTRSTTAAPTRWTPANRRASPSLAHLAGEPRQGCSKGSTTIHPAGSASRAR
jgi:hypothetical protein